MALHSDLKHVLENVAHMEDGKILELKYPLYLEDIDDTIKFITKQGRSLKYILDKGMIMTLSKLEVKYQSRLQMNVLAQFDKRQNPFKQ